MKVAARVLTVLAMLVGVLALTSATAGADSSRDEGSCHSTRAPASSEIVVQTGPGFYGNATLKHKVKNNGNEQFDLRCKGQNEYLEPGTSTGPQAMYTCMSMGFYGEGYGDWYEYGIPGYVTKAKLKVNANGKFTLTCRYKTDDMSEW